MPEYIEREAKYIDINKVTIPTGFFNQDLNVHKLLDWLNSQPTADVAEVKHGEWVQISKDWRSTGNKCSICGFKHYTYHTSTNYRFCPNCGAKMDEKEKRDA